MLITIFGLLTIIIVGTTVAAIKDSNYFKGGMTYEND